MINNIIYAFFINWCVCVFMPFQVKEVQKMKHKTIALCVTGYDEEFEYVRGIYKR